MDFDRGHAHRVRISLHESHNDLRRPQLGSLVHRRDCIEHGPWKFAACRTYNEGERRQRPHTFTAVSFRESAMPMGKLRNINIQKTSRDKFLQSKNYMEEDPMRRISTESISNITVTANKSILINGVPLIQRPNGYTPSNLNNRCHECTTADHISHDYFSASSPPCPGDDNKAMLKMPTSSLFGNGRALILRGAA